jgi:GDP-4-dehydro-6-deoxy-D-mannose reductase
VSLAAPNPDAERVLITGATGFVGTLLTDAIRRRWPGWVLEPRSGPLEGKPRALDITDAAEVEQLVSTFRPTILIHLAAISSVAFSLKDPAQTWVVNLTGTLNLCYALKHHAPACRLLHVSSGEVYGLSLGDPRPCDEGALLQPVNPYAASKAAADILVRQLAMDGLSTMVARPFNHTGPGQPPQFVVPSFAAQIARIERGLQPPVLKVGDLSSKRDFLDVTDVIAAYMAMLEQRQSIVAGEVFNISSGTATEIREILDWLLGLARTPIRVEADPTLMRPTVIQNMVGDNSRLMRRFGWSPQINLRACVAAILEDQRIRLEASAIGG